MAEHKGQVEAGGQSDRTRGSKGGSAASMGMAPASPAASASTLQRTLGNRALGSTASRSAHATGDFVGSLLQRVAIVKSAAKGADIQRDPFFRPTPTAPTIRTSAAAGTVQRFKEVKDGKEITSDDIEKATTEKLLQWQARDGVEGLDAELVPDMMDLFEIGVELNKRSEAEKAKAAQDKEKEKQDRIAQQRQEMLAKLGVTEPEYTEISRTTTNEKAITKVSNWCMLRKITVTSALDAVKGYDEHRRLIALEVFGRGEVNAVSDVVAMLDNWAALNDRDAIDIGLLTKLLDAKAMTAGGGIYRVPRLTGTQDIAIPFLSNGTTERRIDPEFHVHYTLKNGPSNPGFKWQKHKKDTGAGTRRVIDNKGAVDALLKASGAI